MNTVMKHGKKSAAESIVYGAFDQVESKVKQSPVAVFHQALENISPALEVRSRRVGGATYQVPVEVRPERRQALALRWLLARPRPQREDHGRTGSPPSCIDASNNRGSAVKKREDTHRMAEANRAFSHYRW